MNNTTSKNSFYTLESIDDIKDFFKDLQIFARVESVSQSWMSRNINFYIAFDNDIKNINHIISKITWYKQNKNTWAIRVSWCGMDMIFHVVYNFYTELYNDWYYRGYLSF